MKKTLAMALGAMMIGGLAASAEAASHVDFSGYYRVNYMIDNNRAFTNKDATFSDHYFDDRLLIEMSFSPTDEISVHWQLRGPNRDRWGKNTGTDLTSHHIYGLIKQDWGQVLVGRLDDNLDVYGLASLGYLPSFGPYVKYGPFDRAEVLDAVRYTNRWDNGLSLMVQYAKIQAGGWDPNFSRVYDAGGNIIGLAGVNGEVANGSSDEDFDRYQAEVSYFWDGGGASLGFMWDRDATGAYRGTARHYDGTIEQDKTNAFYVNPAIMHSWGNFSVHFEGMAGWGSSDFRGTKSYDSDGYGAYLDFDYNYGPGNVNLAGWWVSGSDMGDDESGSLVDIVGGNFYPLLVAYGYTGNGKYRGATRSDSRSRSFNAIGIANNGYENFIAPALVYNNTFLNNSDMSINSIGLDYHNMINNRKFNWSSFNQDTDANHWAVSLSGNHAFTDDITMHYAVAYLAMNNPNYRVADSASCDAAGTYVYSYKEQDKDLGFEVDLGFQFQFLDNLSFTSSFGYMFTGDAYKELRGYNVDATGTVAKAKWRDADDTYVWYNTLQFDF